MVYHAVPNAVPGPTRTTVQVAHRQDRYSYPWKILK